MQGGHATHAAGADCIETNTFGANRFKLAIHGLEGQTREVNRRGVRLARDVRESAGRDVWVLGSIGPLGKYLEPLGTLTVDEAREAFREQAEALLEGGADAFVVETFSDLAEIRLAIDAIRSVTDLPIVAQMAFTDEAVTFMGRPPAEVARDLRALGVQAIGANCSVGSSTLYDVLERMAPEAGGLPLAIQPNAGLPSRIGERLIYLSSPAYMGEYAGRMVEAGARLVGGCCVHASHTAAMRGRSIGSRPGRGGEAPCSRAASARPSPLAPARPAPRYSPQRARHPRFVVTVDCPRAAPRGPISSRREALNERGPRIVDTTTLARSVPDSVLATALLVRDGTGLPLHALNVSRRNLGDPVRLLAPTRSPSAPSWP